MGLTTAISLNMLLFATTIAGVTPLAKGACIGLSKAFGGIMAGTRKFHT